MKEQPITFVVIQLFVYGFTHIKVVDFPKIFSSRRHNPGIVTFYVNFESEIFRVTFRYFGKYLKIKVIFINR